MATVLQLPRLLEGHVQASPAMVRAAVLEDARRLRETNFDDLLDRRRHRRFAAVLTAIVAGAALGTLAAPGAVKLWARRWFLGSDDAGRRRLMPRSWGWGMVDNFMFRARATRRWSSSKHVPIWSNNPMDGWCRDVAKRWSYIHRLGPKAACPSGASVRYQDSLGSKLGNFSRGGESRFRYELPPVFEPLELRLRPGTIGWGQSRWCRSTDRRSINWCSWPGPREHAKASRCATRGRESLAVPAQFGLAATR